MLRCLFPERNIAFKDREDHQVKEYDPEKNAVTIIVESAYCSLQNETKRNQIKRNKTKPT